MDRQGRPGRDRSLSSSVWTRFQPHIDEWESATVVVCPESFGNDKSGPRDIPTMPSSPRWAYAIPPSNARGALAWMIVDGIESLGFWELEVQV